MTENVIDAVRIIKRQKRDNDQCSLDCLDKLGTRLQNSPGMQEYGAAQKQYPLVVCRWYNPTVVTEMCSVKADVTKCVAACPSGQIKDLTNKILNAFYICDDQFKNFAQVYPCINRTCPEIDKACGDLCRSYKGNADKLFQIAAQAEQGTKPHIDMQTVKDIVGDTCSYMSCYSRCAKPFQADKCGNATAEFESGVVSRTLSSLTELVTAIGAGSVLPQSCRSVEETTGQAKSSTQTGAAPPRFSISTGLSLVAIVLVVIRI